MGLYFFYRFSKRFELTKGGDWVHTKGSPADIVSGKEQIDVEHKQRGKRADVRLIHWGRTRGLKELDSSCHGQSLWGAEFKRKEADPDHRRTCSVISTKQLRNLPFKSFPGLKVYLTIQKIGVLMIFTLAVAKVQSSRCLLLDTLSPIKLNIWFRFWFD